MPNIAKIEKINFILKEIKLLKNINLKQCDVSEFEAQNLFNCFNYLEIKLLRTKYNLRNKNKQLILNKLLQITNDLANARRLNSLKLNDLSHFELSMLVAAIGKLHEFTKGKLQR
jgi:hypothetical protein